MSKFTIDGSDVAFNAIPPIVQRTIEIAEGLKDMELISTRGLAVALNSTTGTINTFSAHPALTENRTMHQGNKLVWGNKKTIAAFKRDRP